MQKDTPSTSVLSLFGNDADVLRRRAALYGQMAEIRLDLSSSELDLKSLFARDESQGTSIPWIATCLPESQGGAFQGGRDKHAESMLRAARAGASFLDIPLDFEPPLDESCARLPWIHSIHCPKGAPLSEAQFDLMERRMRPQDYGKVVLWADTFEESLAAIRLQERLGKRFVVFAQGEGGQASRLWSRALGAPWVYCGWPSQVTAPGQLTAFEQPLHLPVLDILAGVIGQPVSHSLSPFLWQTAASQSEPAHLLPYAHVSLTSCLKDALLDFPAPEKLAAFSVTTPFKQEAYAFADEASDTAHSLESANLLIRQNGKWWAHNTDGDGALAALGLSQATKGEIHVLGRGASAQAVAESAIRSGFSATCYGRDSRPSFDSDSLALVQATPVGSERNPGNLMRNEKLPAALPVLDLVYPPANTELLQQCRDSDGIPISALEMLRQQAALQMDSFAERFLLASKWAERTRSEDVAFALSSVSGSQLSSYVLIGPRGSGKTTLGRQLAHQLGLAFVDSDEALWEEHQARLAQDDICDFASWVQKATADFRHAEREWLKEAVLLNDVILATGGGIVESSECVSILRAHPQVLWLDATPEQSLQRCSGSERPAMTELDPLSEMTFLYEKRLPFWEALANRRIFSGSDGLELLLEAVASFST